MLRIAHRIWKETKQEPATAEPGNMLGGCLVSIHFLWAIPSTSTVVVPRVVRCIILYPVFTKLTRRLKAKADKVSPFHYPVPSSHEAQKRLNRQMSRMLIIVIYAVGLKSGVG